MVIPPLLKIGGHLYTVVLTTDQDILEGAPACMSERLGTIWVNSDMPKSIQESSLLHEIFHCMGYTLADSEFGHALVDALSEQLYQVLKDNALYF